MLHSSILSAKFFHNEAEAFKQVEKIRRFLQLVLTSIPSVGRDRPGDGDCVGVFRYLRRFARWWNPHSVRV